MFADLDQTRFSEVPAPFVAITDQQNWGRTELIGSWRRTNDGDTKIESIRIEYAGTVGTATSADTVGDNSWSVATDLETIAPEPVDEDTPARRAASTRVALLARKFARSTISPEDAARLTIVTEIVEQASKMLFAESKSAILDDLERSRERAANLEARLRARGA